MSGITSCPKCARHVTLPAGAHPADTVRCPLCQTEYSLQEALDSAPPALLVVRSLAVIGTPVEPDADLHLFQQPAQKSPAFDFAERESELDELGLGGQEFDSQHGSGAHATSDEMSLDELSFDDTTETEDSPRDADGMGGPLLHEPQAGEETADDFAATSVAFEEAPADAADEIGLEPREAAEQPFGISAAGPGAPLLTTSPRRERRKPSMLAGLIIWSTSLPVAAVLAYAILLWGFGRDPVGLAPKLPKFLVPASVLQASTPNRTTNNASVPAPQQIAQAPPARNNDDELPGFESKAGALPPRTGEKPAETLPFANDDTPADQPTDASATAAEPADAADEDVEMTDRADRAEPADTAGTDETDDTDLAASEAAGTETADTDTAGTGDLAADSTDNAGMDDEPTETAVAATDAPDETADEPAADADVPSTGDVAVSDAADVPGSDLTAPEEADAELAVVGPRDEVHYSPDDLSRALTEVQHAGKSLAGADKESAKKLKAQYYRKLYQLAEVATFADAQTDGEKDEIYQVLAQAAADRPRFSELGKAAGKWLSAAKGKEHQGIVLSGSIQNVAKQGDVFETRILLTDGAQTVSVLSPQKLPLNANEPVVVLGSIVTAPNKHIAGYAGEEPTAVWSGLVMKAPAGG